MNGRVRYAANLSMVSDGTPCIAAMRASKPLTDSANERSNEMSFLFGNGFGTGYRATSDRRHPEQ